MRTWRLYAVGCALAAVAGLSADGRLAHDVWWHVIRFGAVAAVLLGMAKQPRGRRHPWAVLAAGLACFAIAGLLHTTSAFLGFPDAAAARPIADLGALAGYLTVGVAVHLLVRAQTQALELDSVIDSLIVMIALATLLWDLLLTIPLAADATALTRVVVVVLPLLQAAVTAVCARLVFVGGGHSRSAWLLLLAGVAALAGNIAWPLLASHGITGTFWWLDAVWMLAVSAAGAAALHPSAEALTRPAQDDQAVVPFARLCVLAVSLLAGPTTLLNGTGATGVGTTTPIVASFLVSLLVIWRMTRLVADREHDRSELHKRAERQTAIARIGELALGELDLDALHAEVEAEVVRLTGALGCRIEPTPAADVPAFQAVRGDVRVRIGSGSDAAGIVVAAMPGHTDGEVSFLQALASLLAVATLRRRSEDAMRHQALHDPLTGLPNRLLLDDRLSQALARRDGTPVCVLFIDLDGFKAVNDFHGHAMGDRLLQACAQRLRGQMRPDDTLVRFAGDEFVVVAEHITPKVAAALADRLITVISAPFDLGEALVRVTCSVGMALSEGDEDPDDVLRRADAAMYEAKGSAHAPRASDRGRACLADGRRPEPHDRSAPLAAR